MRGHTNSTMAAIEVITDIMTMDIAEDTVITITVHGAGIITIPPADTITMTGMSRLSRLSDFSFRDFLYTSDRSIIQKAWFEYGRARDGSAILFSVSLA